MFFSLKNHFGSSCKHAALAAGDVPAHLAKMGYDDAKMVAAGLLDASSIFVMVTVPQLYSGEEVVESSRSFPRLLINYEYIVREKTTQEIVENQFTMIKAGRVVKHEKFLTPEALAVNEEMALALGMRGGPSLFTN